VSDDVPTRRLTVRLPVDLVEKVYSAAEISHRTVDDFVEAILAREIARWDEAFGQSDRG
jgi:uncharacterized protein (DUF1778 family)